MARSRCLDVGFAQVLRAKRPRQARPVCRAPAGRRPRRWARWPADRPVTIDTPPASRTSAQSYRPAAGTKRGQTRIAHAPGHRLRRGGERRPEFPLTLVQRGEHLAPARVDQRQAQWRRDAGCQRGQRRHGPQLQAVRRRQRPRGCHTDAQAGEGARAPRPPPPRPGRPSPARPRPAPRPRAASARPSAPAGPTAPPAPARARRPRRRRAGPRRRWPASRCPVPAGSRRPAPCAGRCPRARASPAPPRPGMAASPTAGHSTNPIRSGVR